MAFILSIHITMFVHWYNQLHFLHTFILLLFLGFFWLCTFLVLFCGHWCPQLWHLIELDTRKTNFSNLNTRALILSGTNKGQPGIRPPSFKTPRQPTIYIALYLIISSFLRFPPTALAPIFEWIDTTTFHSAKKKSQLFNFQKKSQHFILQKNKIKITTFHSAKKSDVIWKKL